MHLHLHHSPVCSGFTAIVDKILTKKYDKLVNDAPELIKVLPWGPDYEVDVSQAIALWFCGKANLSVGMPDIPEAGLHRYR